MAEQYHTLLSEQGVELCSLFGPKSFILEDRKFMRLTFILIIGLSTVIPWIPRVYAINEQARESVILLHGLARTSESMLSMEEALKKVGFTVHNIDYSTRHGTIEDLSERIVGAAIELSRQEGADKIHFVTHSMGGILVRHYFAQKTIPELGRVVMLGPPNQGSEVVDYLGSYLLFQWINGVAGTQLGTDSNSVPQQLGPPSFSVGVIAGSRSINWINSLMIPDGDDGKVSLESTKLEGMQDFIVLPVTHPFIMKDEESIKQTIHFLKTGSFIHPVPK